MTKNGLYLEGKRARYCVFVDFSPLFYFILFYFIFLSILHMLLSSIKIVAGQKRKKSRRCLTFMTHATLLSFYDAHGGDMAHRAHTCVYNVIRSNSCNLLVIY